MTADTQPAPRMRQQPRAAERLAQLRSAAGTPPATGATSPAPECANTTASPPARGPPKYATVLSLPHLLWSCLLALYAWVMAFPPPARWTGPPDWLRRGLARFVLWLHPVEYQWLGRVPEPGERILYVANHNLLALDTPHLWAVIYLSTGQWPRGLSDKLHFIVPGTSHLVWWLGGIRGDQTNCELAMQHGLPLLVFPGGTNEVLKKRHDAKYQLRWNDRRGFARYALKHGYTIVPVALIGIDDMCRIVGDVPLGWVARLAGDKRVDVTAPLVVPSGTWEKQYAVFGEPVEAAAFGAWDVEQDVVALRDKVRDTVQDLVAHALARRTADPERYLAPRLRSMIIGASRAGEA